MKYNWWILQAVMILVSLFFLVFGIDLLRGAYSLDNPFNFIMVFFAASFIILISITLGASFLIKIIRVFNRMKNTNP